jgi:hypothetical protein
MDWLIDLFFGFAVGYVVVSLVQKYQERKKLENFKQAVVEKVEEQIQNVIRLHVRSFNNCFYAYDAETEEFYAQGATLDEMVINLRENTKRSQAVFVSSDEEARQHVIDFLKSKLGKNPTAVGVNNDA